jgi:hypothetical protein
MGAARILIGLLIVSANVHATTCISPPNKSAKAIAEDHYRMADSIVLAKVVRVLPFTPDTIGRADIEPIEVLKGSVPTRIAYYWPTRLTGVRLTLHQGETRLFSLWGDEAEPCPNTILEERQNEVLVELRKLRKK